jgi:Putative restriction endonuclease
MNRVRPFTERHEDYCGGLFYPSEDGDAEPDRDALPYARRLLREGLEDYFALDLGVYVGSRIPVYGNRPGRHLLGSPDVLVAFRTTPRERTAWRIRQEGKPPAVCLHVLTAANLAKLLGPVKTEYERARVSEYLVFDPSGRYLAGHVAGFRLRRDRFRTIRPAADGGVWSRQLGLRLVAQYGYPRFVEVATGKVVLTRHEQAIRSVRRKRAERSPNGAD